MILVTSNDLTLPLSTVLYLKSSKKGLIATTKDGAYLIKRKIQQYACYVPQNFENFVLVRSGLAINAKHIKKIVINANKGKYTPAIVYLSNDEQWPLVRSQIKLVTKYLNPKQIVKLPPVPPVFKPIACALCGNSFIPKSGNNQFCSFGCQARSKDKGVILNKARGAGISLTLKQVLGPRLKECREAANLNLTQVGAVKGALSKFESPKFPHFPDKTTLNQLAKLYKVNPFYLTGQLDTK